MSKEKIEFESFCKELRENPWSRNLHDRYYQPLFEYANSIIHDPRNAELIIADIFRQIRMENFSSIDELKGFLYEEVRKHCKKFLQAKALWKAMIKKEPLDAETIMEGMLFQELYDSSHELPQQQKGVINLLFFLRSKH